MFQKKKMSGQMMIKNDTVNDTVVIEVVDDENIDTPVAEVVDKNIDTVYVAEVVDESEYSCDAVGEIIISKNNKEVDDEQEDIIQVHVPKFSGENNKEDVVENVPVDKKDSGDQEEELTLVPSEPNHINRCEYTEICNSA